MPDRKCCRLPLNFQRNHCLDCETLRGDIWLADGPGTNRILRWLCGMDSFGNYSEAIIPPPAIDGKRSDPAPSYLGPVDFERKAGVASSCLSRCPSNRQQLEQHLNNGRIQQAATMRPSIQIAGVSDCGRYLDGGYVKQQTTVFRCARNRDEVFVEVDYYFEFGMKYLDSIV